MNQRGSLPGGMYKYTNAGKLLRYITALSEESTSPIKGQRRYSCCITNILRCYLELWAAALLHKGLDLQKRFTNLCLGSMSLILN